MHGHRRRLYSGSPLSEKGGMRGEKAGRGGGDGEQSHVGTFSGGGGGCSLRSARQFHYARRRSLVSQVRPEPARVPPPSPPPPLRPTLCIALFCCLAFLRSQRQVCALHLMSAGTKALKNKNNIILIHNHLHYINIQFKEQPYFYITHSEA